MVTSPLLYKLTRLALGASAGPGYLIRTSSVCVTASAWAGTCYRNCTARHRKLQLTPFLAKPTGMLGNSMKGERPYFQEGVGIFPCPFGRNLSWLPPEARPTCFSKSASVSQFLLVCAVFTTVLLKEFSWEKGLFPPQLGMLLLQKQLPVFPLC